MESILKYPRTPHLEGSRLQAGDDASTQVPYAHLKGKYIVVAPPAGLHSAQTPGQSVGWLGGGVFRGNPPGFTAVARHREDA